MRYYRHLILGIFAAISMNACYNTSDYRGHGHLEDMGFFEAHHRFILTIAEIQIGVPGDFEFDIHGLPSKEFVFGLELELPDVGPEENLREHIPCDPKVRFQLLDKSKETSFMDAEGRIASDWIWSIGSLEPSAFLYLRGDADTRFKPASRHQQYTMVVRIFVPPEESCEFTAVLVAKSPGWK